MSELKPNQVHIVLQSKEDPKDLLSTKEKAAKMPDGLTVVFMEEATEKGQIGVEFIIRGEDVFGRETINAATVTENNMEGICGAFIGARMRFKRMAPGQYDLVKGHVREQLYKFAKEFGYEQCGEILTEAILKEAIENFLKKL